MLFQHLLHIWIIGYNKFIFLCIQITYMQFWSTHTHTYTQRITKTANNVTFAAAATATQPICAYSNSLINLIACCVFSVCAVHFTVDIFIYMYYTIHRCIYVFYSYASIILYMRTTRLPSSMNLHSFLKCTLVVFVFITAVAPTSGKYLYPEYSNVRARMWDGWMLSTYYYFPHHKRMCTN